MKRFKYILLFLFSLFLFSSIHAAMIPADQAFKLSAQRKDSSTIQAQWNIADGYHLYKSEISIALANDNGTVLGKIELPPGIPEHSQVLGNYDVYKNKLIVEIPVSKWGKKNTELVFNYQGCKEGSVCYPPQTKVISIEPPQELPKQSISDPTLSSTQQLLESGNIFLILASFFVFGLFLSLTPCVLPMIPILVGIIMGQKGIKTSKALFLSMTYVFGVAVTYAIAGIITAMLGSSIQAILQNFWVILLCGLIFVTLALSLFGLYELRLPSSIMTKLSKASQKTHKGTYIGVFLMGAISSLIVSPCVSAPLAGALIYIASTGNILLGGSALFVLALGMGVLLVIVGVTGGKLFLKTGMWMAQIRNLLGVIMLAMAIWLVSRVIPEMAANILWAILLMGVGYYSGAFDTQVTDSMFGKSKKFLSFLILLGGVFIAEWTLINPIAPINPISQKASSHSDDLFNEVTTPEEMQKLIDKAIAENKPVMIDYYADWCTSCKEMDATTFKNSDVRYALKPFILIRADITKNNPDSDALKAKYKVFAPPYLIFLDNKGNALKDSASAGFIKADDLIGQANIISSLYAQN